MRLTSRRGAVQSKRLLGSGALHLLSAYACEDGLVIGQCAVDRKCNEIKANPDLLEMLAITGTIVAIDAMGTRKRLPRRLGGKKPITFWRLKESTLHDDMKRVFEDAALAKTCAVHKTTDAGHGLRKCRARMPSTG